MTSSTDYPTGLNPVYDRRRYEPELKQETISYNFLNEADDLIDYLIFVDYTDNCGLISIESVMYTNGQAPISDVYEAVKEHFGRHNVEFNNNKPTFYGK